MKFHEVTTFDLNISRTTQHKKLIKLYLNITILALFKFVFMKTIQILVISKSDFENGIS